MVASLVQMAGAPMAIIEGTRVVKLKCRMELREVRPGRLNEQMEAVGHPHIAEEADIICLKRTLQQIQEREPILIVLENLSLVIAAASDVICSGKLYSQWSRHASQRIIADKKSR
jgi:hypothetical protein